MTSGKPSDSSSVALPEKHVGLAEPPYRAAPLFNLATSQIILETLRHMDIKAPEATVDIDEIRRKYHQAVEGEGGNGSR